MMTGKDSLFLKKIINCLACVLLRMLPEYIGGDVNRQLKLGVKLGMGFTPIILATQEVEIRRIMVQSQSGKIVHETLP
jgi:hypothetical protein